MRGVVHGAAGVTITTPTTPEAPPGRPHLQEETRRCSVLGDDTLMHCTLTVQVTFLELFQSLQTILQSHDSLLEQAASQDKTHSDISVHL